MPRSLSNGRTIQIFSIVVILFITLFLFSMIFLPIILADKSCLTVGLICDTHCEVSSSEKDVFGRSNTERTRVLLENLEYWDFDVVFNLGDCDQGWNNFASVFGSALDDTYYVKGNHDWYYEDFVNNTGDAIYYSIMKDGIHFVFLGDCTEDSNAETDNFSDELRNWLCLDLQSYEGFTSVVVSHYPAKSNTQVGQNNDTIDYETLRILEDYGVEISLGGHHHKRMVGEWEDWVIVSPLGVDCRERYGGEKDVLPLGVLKIYPDKIIYEEYDVDSNDLLFSEEFEVTTTFDEDMSALNMGTGAGFGVVIGVAIVGLAIILMAVKKVNLGFSVQQSG